MNSNIVTKESILKEIIWCEDRIKSLEKDIEFFTEKIDSYLVQVVKLEKKWKNSYD